MSNAKLTPEVVAILDRSTITGNTLVLPPGQLECKLYEAVNKALVNAGGKWNRSAGGHVFPSSPREKLGLMLETGVSVDQQQKFQAFNTPPALAARMAAIANVDGKSVLEPSAGDGSLVRACLASGARSVECVELNEENRQKLIGANRTVQIADFLTVEPDVLFDRVVMNPPFTKGQDVKHVTHARRFLKQGGLLVAIVSAGPKAEAALREISDTWEEIPAGTFKEEGTNVRTVLLTITN